MDFPYRPPCTCIKSRPSFHKSTLRPVCLHPSMGTHDGQRNSPVLNQVPKPDKTPDPVKLPRGISDVEVKLSANLVTGTVGSWVLPYSTDCVVMYDEGRLICGSAQDDAQKRREACNTMVVYPPVLSLVGDVYRV
ncbi:TonB box [Echinococcus multilocularis]|uniref:TonB box n=1 Tax=Echinococcus multilocularis TaxID=6211 RepID=A0A087VY28_ECHMU|nr:TonB box [Echinococcus multilocularis]